MPMSHPGSSLQRYITDLLLTLSRLCPCLPHSQISHGPPSPPDSPQQDELQLLLSSAGDDGEWGWSENGDDLPIGHSNYRSQRFARQSVELNASQEHGHSYPSRRTSSVFPSSAHIDSDARSLRPSTIEGLAMQYEPSLTLADIEREEREQATKEQSRRSIGLAEEDDFGDYTGAGRGDMEEAAEVSFGLETFQG